jgi:O-methyltransferase involved in polyketide biosynthesis
VAGEQDEKPAEWLKDASLANHLDHPSPARIYDYLLGGVNNYAVDRMFANSMLAKMPDLRPAAVLNRRFLQRAVRFAVQRGYRQFIDIGSGLPSQGNVHEVADEAAPGETKVVYVDNEPIAHAHSSALLADTADRRRHAALHADFFARRATWNAVLKTKLINPDQPVCLLTVALLHFMPPEQEPEATLAWYREQLPPGSMLILSHASDALDDASFQDVAASYNKQSAGNAYLRTREEITALFGDFELVEPGLDWAPLWRPDIEFTGDATRSRVLAGVAIKK